MIIMLLGAPGSGKGTVSNYLKKEHNFYHISTGDLFRKTIAENSPLANQLKERMAAGKLIDDNLTNAVVKQELLKINNKDANIIFDGYPRNIHQLEFLNDLIKVDYAIDVHVNSKELMKRITGRRTCPVCKEIYNIYYKQPRTENICDKDGALLVQRADDKAEAVEERLKVYNKLNQPIIDCCKKMGILHTIENDTFENAINQLKNILNLR